MTVLLSTTHLAKRFPNGTQALADLSFTLNGGDFVSLLGPSGCGKSTALRIVAGLAPPDGGAVAFGAGKPETGFVFQEPTLMPWAGALANVRLPLDLKHVPRGEANDRAAAALARVGLAGFERARPRELSGGMKMRAALARALVTEPRLLLMDEPFAALDEITRFKLANDLLTLWQELRRTVIFVTHSVFESVYLSTRIVVMTPRPGRVATVLTIDAPQPRDARFRTSAEYAAFCRMTSDALAAAMMEGAA